MAHPLEGIMQSTMEQLRQLAMVDTVIGKPVHVSETTCIIPVSRASLGFLTGGGEYGVNSPVLTSGMSLDNSNRAYPFAGTMAAGVSLTPVAFLAVTGDTVRLLPATERETCARLAALLPELMREAAQMVRDMRGEAKE